MAEATRAEDLAILTRNFPMTPHLPENRSYCALRALASLTKSARAASKIRFLLGMGDRCNDERTRATILVVTVVYPNVSQVEAVGRSLMVNQCGLATTNHDKGMIIWQARKKDCNAIWHT